VAVRRRDIAYVENGLGVYILLQSKFFDAIREIVILADHLGRGFGCAKYSSVDQTVVQPLMDHTVEVILGRSRSSLQVLG
jgi:hypothetical protein